MKHRDRESRKERTSSQFRTDHYCQHWPRFCPVVHNRLVPKAHESQRCFQHTGFFTEQICRGGKSMCTAAAPHSNCPSRSVTSKARACPVSTLTPRKSALGYALGPALLWGRDSSSVLCQRASEVQLQSSLLYSWCFPDLLRVKAQEGERVGGLILSGFYIKSYQKTDGTFKEVAQFRGREP